MTYYLLGIVQDVPLIEYSGKIEYERGQRRKISDWIMHPQTKSDYFQNQNIALVKTEKEFVLNNFINFIRPISFMRFQGRDVSTYYSVCNTFIFWKQNKLLAVPVTVLKLAECKQVLPHVEVKHYHMCCMISSIQSDNLCPATLGSPLICKNHQIGIVVSSLYCINISLYIRIDLYQDWIQSNVKRNLWYENIEHILRCHVLTNITRKEYQAIGKTGHIQVFSSCLLLIILESLIYL